MPDSKAKWITGLMFLIMIFLFFYGVSVDLESRFGANLGHGLAVDAVLLSIWVFVLFKFYDDLHFNVWTYSSVMFAILFHVAGDVYLYGKSMGAVQFDMVVHFLFGLVISLFIYQFFLGREAFDESPTLLGLIVFLTFLGLSGLHEVAEFLGYSFLGHGGGILYFGPGDAGEWYDAMWDLISGGIGAFIGVAVSHWRR